MLTFKTLSDLDQLRSTDPPHGIIKKLVESSLVEGRRPGYPYAPAADGYVVLIQEDDLVGNAQDVWNRQALIEVLWEGVHREGDHYIAVQCPNNQFCLVFVIPDACWLGDELRAVLDDNLVPTTD